MYKIFLLDFEFIKLDTSTDVFGKVHNFDKN